MTRVSFYADRFTGAVMPATGGIIMAFSLCLYAINPILPINLFTPDVEAHKWLDGRIYLYGSNDIANNNGYCSNLYHVYSSADLINWTDHGESFHSTGANDEVPWSNANLFAPDCMYKNGTYYLYFCLSMGPDNEGVATSASPYGPFKNGVKIAGMSGIDPAVFIDDDGQGYVYWGQFNSKAAKLKPNMLEIDQSTIKSNVLTESQHHFHEGSSMRKRNGIYYNVYADIGRGKPTCLGYATGTSPLGPFSYRGVIIDNNGCDPGVWNNHGSIEEFNDKWYVFYHRSSRGGVYSRRVCVEPISFNPDGTIPEVPMTSQGVEEPLSALSRLEAEIACGLTGTAKLTNCSEGGEQIESIKNGNSAVYRFIDFGGGVADFSARVASQTAGGNIELRLDSMGGRLIGTCGVQNTGGWKTWTTRTCTISGASGVHPLYLKFTGGGTELFNINWFTFTPVTSSRGGVRHSWNGTDFNVNVHSAASICFSAHPLASEKNLRFSLFDIKGKLVQSMSTGMTRGGNYSLPLKTPLVPGIYLAALMYGYNALSVKFRVIE